MARDDENSHRSTSISGTPRDYSEDLYRFFLETVDPDRTAKKMLIEFLGSKNANSLVEVENGYELNMPIQCAPDLVRILSHEVAIYQLVRHGRVAGEWRP